MTWDNTSKIATVKKGSLELALTEENTPFEIRDDRLYVPLRQISEQLNFTVSWQQEEYAIYLASQ